MSIAILRRRRLGRTSCREIVNNMQTPAEVLRNDTMRDEDFEGVDMVVRWGTTSSVPARNILNTAHAIHQVNDKAGFRKVLNEKSLCPETWFHINDVPVVAGSIELVRPIVMRPARHAQGRHLYVCYSYHDLHDAHHELGSPIHYYISELIDKVAEYRVFVVQGRAVCVAKKTPGNPEDVAWNVARGGRFDNVRWGEWPLQAVEHAIRAFNLSELDFGGVDVMVDGNGQPYVIEINSAPSLTSPYRQSCMAKAFDYIVERGKARMTCSVNEGWRGFVHPAISEEAIGV